MMCKLSGLFFTLVLSALNPLAALGAELWYQDNVSRGMPADSIEKFREPDSFEQAAQYIDVYLISANVLKKVDDEFLATTLLPYLRRTV